MYDVRRLFYPTVSLVSMSTFPYSVQCSGPVLKFEGEKIIHLLNAFSPIGSFSFCF